MTEDFNPWHVPHKKTTQRLWHYTDASGLLGMLSTDTLWCSAATHLNDPGEVDFGFTTFLAALEAEIRRQRRSAGFRKELLGLIAAERPDDVFIVSASMDGDSLSQWKQYAGTTPYAVAFDGDWPLAILGTPSRVQGDWTYPALRWREVQYGLDGEPYRDYVRGYVRDAARFGERRVRLTTSLPRDYVTWNFALLTKASGFSAEREARIATALPPEVEALDFRTGRFGITPMIRLTGSGHGPEGNFNRELVRETPLPLPIREVRVGPSPTAALLEAGAKSALRHYGYQDVPVTHSGHSPLR